MAPTCSPNTSSGTPTATASKTAGWRDNAFSTSVDAICHDQHAFRIGGTFSPPRMMISLTRDLALVTRVTYVCLVYTQNPLGRRLRCPPCLAIRRSRQRAEWHLHQRNLLFSLTFVANIALHHLRASDQQETRPSGGSRFSRHRMDNSNVANRDWRTAVLSPTYRSSYQLVGWASDLLISSLTR